MIWLVIMVRKILIFSVGIFLVAGYLVISQTSEGKVSVFALFADEKNSIGDYTFPKPDEVVQQYFEAWDRKDYPTMYSTFSDGFRKIDENAATLDDFRNYTQAQRVESVKIVGVRMTSNNGLTASVDYSVEFTLADSSTKSFSGTYTLKFRTGDIIRGWKLIHPYGENIDTSEEGLNFEELCKKNGNSWMKMQPIVDGKMVDAPACDGCMIGNNHVCSIGEYLQVLNK